MVELTERVINALELIAKSINDSNASDQILVGATITAVISSIIFGVISLRRSQKQSEESWKKQERAHNELVRPWISIKPPQGFQVIYQNNDVEPYDDFVRKQNNQKPVRTITLAYLCSNNGQRPAINIGETIKFSDESFSRQELENEPETVLKMSLAPQQELSKQIQMKFSRWIKLDQQPIYLGLRVSYDTGLGRSFSGGIYKFSNEGPGIVETWYE